LYPSIVPAATISRSHQFTDALCNLRTVFSIHCFVHAVPNYQANVTDSDTAKCSHMSPSGFELVHSHHHFTDLLSINFAYLTFPETRLSQRREYTSNSSRVLTMFPFCCSVTPSSHLLLTCYTYPAIAAFPRQLTH
jgi:hypothetical protein